MVVHAVISLGGPNSSVNSKTSLASHSQFKASLSNKTRPCLKKEKKKSDSK